MANEQNGQEKGLRISITIDQSLRRMMRIAAAHRDQTVGEWAQSVLEAAAEKVTRQPRS